MPIKYHITVDTVISTLIPLRLDLVRRIWSCAIDVRRWEFFHSHEAAATVWTVYATYVLPSVRGQPLQAAACVHRLFTHIQTKGTSWDVHKQPMIIAVMQSPAASMSRLCELAVASTSSQTQTAASQPHNQHCHLDVLVCLFGR